MSRRPSRYAVHLLLEGGHRHQIQFPDLESFQSWYAESLNKPDAQALSVLAKCMVKPGPPPNTG